MSKLPKDVIFSDDGNGNYVTKNGVRSKKTIEEHWKEIILEMHADGVKEVEECPFCHDPCEEPHCPYTEEE